jgi:trigger factor
MSFAVHAKVAELVDALALGASGVTRESSSLSFRTMVFSGRTAMIDPADVGINGVMTDLQIAVEASQGLERRLKVQVPAAQIETEVELRLRKVRQSAKLKGFRPGKVPPKVIQQRYGGQVRQEVLQDIIQSSYGRAIDEQKLRPAGMPQIEPGQLESGKDFSYTATFEIYPEIQLSGLNSLKIEQPEVEIGDADVDDMVDTLRKQRSNWEPVERKSADGDRVTVDFEGTLKGEPIENGRGEQVPIVLGQRQMLEDFEKNLIGLSAGDEKTFKVKFPKDYQATELAGKKVSFSATVTEVAEPQLPDLDEDFVKALGIDSGDVDDFRADVRGNMDREATAKIKAEVKRQVMDQLLDSNSIDIPAVLVEKEAASLQSETMRNMGVTDPQQAPSVETFNEAAQRRVRLGLLVSAVIEENNLVVDREQVKVKVDEICAPYEQPEEMRKLYFQNPQLISQVENVVMEGQVVEWLVSRATLKTKATKFSELMNNS